MVEEFEQEYDYKMGRGEIIRMYTNRRIRSFEPLVAHPTSFIMSNNTVDQDPFPITVAQLSGNFCETIFFGIYLAISTSCVPIFYNAWIKKQQ